MFRRASKRTTVHRLRELLWPSMGWTRLSRYLSLRLRRLSDTPYAVAAGLSCGVAISFTPFIGFHFVLAAVLAWLLSANLFASALGTMAGNPWTFPFIWLWTYRLGNWILGNPEVALPEAVGFGYIFDNFWQVFLPMAVGGILTGLAAWFACFLPMRKVIAGYRQVRNRRRRLKRTVRRTRARFDGPGQRRASGHGIET